MPEFDLGNKIFNEIALDNWKVRNIISKKVEKSVDDSKSTKSMKKKRKPNANNSQDRKSQANESGLEFSQLPSEFNITVPKSEKPSTPQKMKPIAKRNFEANPKMLKRLGADRYEDLSALVEVQQRVGEAVKKLQVMWRETDRQRLTQLIRYQVVDELSKIEERKQVQKEQEERRLNQALKDKEENELKDTLIPNKPIERSPTKGVQFLSQSQFSSPTRFSPTRSKTFTEGGSDLDTKSMYTGVASKAVNLGVLEAEEYEKLRVWLSKGGPPLKSKLKEDNRVTMAVVKGSHLGTSAKSMAGKSRGTRSLTAKSHSRGTRSRKSKVEFDLENLEIDEIDHYIADAE